MLVEQNGKIFHGLLKHLQHHSLALLLISLLELQIQPNQDKKDKARVAWEASEGSDIENEDENAGELTAEQKHMQEVLKEKSSFVINSLIDQLSNKNQDDYQMTLNANTVLQEFCENEHCFSLLTSESALKHIVAACCQTDSNMMNLPYALALLNNIITQFIEQDKDFFKDKKEEFFELFSTHFKDLCYNCLIILKQADPPLEEGQDAYRNQS